MIDDRDRREVGRRRGPRPLQAWRWRVRRSSPRRSTPEPTARAPRPICRWHATRRRAWRDRAAGREANTFERHATEPRQARPDPLPFPIGVERDEPAHASRIEIDTACARTPPGRGTPGCSSQPWGGPPNCSSRSANSSFESGVDPRPPPHTTSRRDDQEPCSTTSAGSDSCSNDWFASSRSAGGARAQIVSRGPQRSDRVDEVGDHLVALVGVERGDGGQVVLHLLDEAVQQRERRLTSARSDARSSSEPRPSTIDQIDASTCPTSTMELRPQVSTDARPPRVANARWQRPGPRAAGSLDPWVRQFTEPHRRPTGVVSTAAA